jgi:Ca2+-binding RTX toxin-like protein
MPRYLFVHQNFPGQFPHVGRALAARGDTVVDSLDGGAGIDTADYTSASAAISANLSTGLSSGLSSGADGIDTLLGNTGADTLDGGIGADRLYGQAGADTFLIRRGTQTDIVADFAIGQDRLDISEYGYASLASAKAAMVQVGADIAFYVGAGDLVILQNIGINALTAAEFVF